MAHSRLRKAIFLTAGLCCAAFGFSGIPYAQGLDSRGDHPVLILGDDSEPGAIKRSSGLYRDVSIALQTQLAQDGYDVIDAEAAGARRGFGFPDRMPRSDLFALFQDLTTTTERRITPKMLVLFRVQASVAQQAYATRIQTRVMGEIYDGETDRLINSFALPPEAFPGPVDCLDNVTNCIDMEIRPRAGDMASLLGDILAQQLDVHTGATAPSLASASSSPATAPPVTSPLPGDMIGAGSALCANPVSELTVELRNFKIHDAQTIATTMDREFPCRVAIDLLPGSNSVLRRYHYATAATSGKIEEWMHILLRDMGYDTDGAVRISLPADKTIRIDKVSP